MIKNTNAYPSSWLAIAALTIASGLAMACTQRAASPTGPSVQKAIEAEIAKSLDATRHQNVDKFMSGFAPDFRIVAPNGDQVTLADLKVHTLRDWAIIPATRDLWMKVDSMGSVAGDTAVVFTQQRWDRLMLQRNGIARDTVITTQKHRELWRLTAQGWRRARVQELGGTVIVNGKPFT